MDEELRINGSSCSNVKIDIDPSSINKTKEMNDEFVDIFSDEVLTEDPNAKLKLKGIISYLKSKRFRDKVNTVAYEKGIPPKQVAKGVISKVFGIISDVLGIAIDTVYCTLSGIIQLLTNILQTGLNLITKVVHKIVTIVTFNQTTILN